MWKWDEDMEVDRIDAYIQKITKKDVPESDRKLRSQNKDKSLVSKPLKAKEKTEKLTINTKNLKHQ